MNRRMFLGIAAPAALAGRLAGARIIPVIDSHIHLFDTARPQGVPWPDKKDQVLYKPALPGRYREVSAGLGVVGAIEIECSPWLEDNQWVLDIAARDPLIVGMVGDLEPANAAFSKQLHRFRKDRLFLGIRYGNLWGRDLGSSLANPRFIAGMKELADAELVLDTANPTAALVSDVIRLSDRIPHLRIVMDHLPQMDPATASLRELAQHPRVFAKISGVLRRVDGRVPLDLSFYRARLDTIWELFGADRVIYGSDWPNSDQWGTYPEVFRLVQNYFHAKGEAAAQKYFWRNSIAAYRWIQREPGQPGI